MLDKIKKLRETTGCGVMDAKKALEETGGDIDKALKAIEEKGLKKAESKSDREVKSGMVYSYNYAGTIGVVLELACETDFVAKNPEFEELCKELGMQIASMNPENVEDLLAQSWIKDGSKTVDGLIKALIAKTGENMQLRRFVRMELGDKIEE
jgi:elongation factor Ts